MRANRLQNALAPLGDARREINAAMEEMQWEHDPLASHIVVSRRNYRNMQDNQSGKRRICAACCSSLPLRISIFSFCCAGVSEIAAT
jgi:hypothetical protein